MITPISFASKKVMVSNKDENPGVKLPTPKLQTLTQDMVSFEGAPSPYKQIAKTLKFLKATLPQAATTRMGIVFSEFRGGRFSVSLSPFTKMGQLIDETSTNLARRLKGIKKALIIDPASNTALMKYDSKKDTPEVLQAAIESGFVIMPTERSKSSLKLFTQKILRRPTSTEKSLREAVSNVTDGILVHETSDPSIARSKYTRYYPLYTPERLAQKMKLAEAKLTEAVREMNPEFKDIQVRIIRRDVNKPVKPDKSIFELLCSDEAKANEKYAEAMKEYKMELKQDRTPVYRFTAIMPVKGRVSPCIQANTPDLDAKLARLELAHIVDPKTKSVVGIYVKNDGVAELKKALAEGKVIMPDANLFPPNYSADTIQGAVSGFENMLKGSILSRHENGRINYYVLSDKAAIA